MTPTKRPEDRKVHRSFSVDRAVSVAIDKFAGDEDASHFVNRILAAILIPDEHYYRLELLMREIGHDDSTAMLRHIIYEAVHERLREDHE